MTDKPRSERLGLEPGSEIDPKVIGPSRYELMHSIAISLKRIADAFERAEKHATGGQP